MKKINYLLFLLVFALVLPQGCDSKKNPKIDGYKEIMAIHDAVMPKMGEVNRLKRTLQTEKSTVEDSLKIANINYSIGELEESEDLMQTWMHQWAEKSQGLDKKSDSYQQFLKEQKKSIINVSDRIYHSMQHAEETLAAIKK